MAAISAAAELERNRCALCMMSVCLHDNCSNQQQMQSEWSVGSWDESLRLWYRVGHPNNTPRGSTAFDDLTEGNNIKVSAVYGSKTARVSMYDYAALTHQYHVLHAPMHDLQHQDLCLLHNIRTCMSE